MKLVNNATQFDTLQPRFVGEVIERVRADLAVAGLSGDALKEACGKVAFSICALIDGAAEFAVEGKEYSSFLAFSENDAELFWPGGNSWLHE